MNYELSFCIPTYKSDKTIEQIIESIFDSFRESRIEIILVNDGSPDKTDQAVLPLIEKYPDFKYISFQKNFGEYNAIMCALRHSSGEYVAVIDDDFQNSMKAVSLLHSKAKEGFDVVFAEYNQNKNSILRSILSYLHQNFTHHFVEMPKFLKLSTFKVINRKIVDVIIKHEGPFPNIESLILKITNNVTNCKVEHEARKSGISAYRFWNLFFIWLNLVMLSNSKLSKILLKNGIFLFLITFIGFLIGFKFSGLEIFQLIIISLLMLLISMILIIGGLILEYLSKIYLTEVKTPQYIIKSKSFK